MSDLGMVGDAYPIALSELKNVSEVAQREFRPDHAKKMAAALDVGGLGMPLVNWRDGAWWIVDGQHRVAALRLAGYDDDFEVACEAFEGLTVQQEASLFLLRNNRRKVSSLDEFKVAVTAGIEPYVDIDRIVRECGLRISESTGVGGLKAVKTLTKVYERSGAEVFAWTLISLRSAYGDEGVKQHLVTGMSMVWHQFGDRIEQEWLIRKLAMIPGGAYGLLGKAQTMTRTTGMPVAHCVAGCIVDAYNQRAGKAGGAQPAKLPSWWRSTAAV